MNIMFQNNEMDSILSDFPKFELSYETMTHKKVFDYNVILAIPDGQKCFAWFTTYKEDNVCFIMDIDTDNMNKITNIQIGITSFKNKLAFGTIFYGTLFNVNGAKCFCIEDLYYYKGVSYSGKTFINRLETLKSILKTEMSQQSVTRDYIIFGFPLMDSDLLSLLKSIDTLPYKVKHLKYRWYETKKIMTSEYYKPSTSLTSSTNVIIKFEKKEFVKKEYEKKEYEKKEYVKQISTAVFHITPDTRSDIYNLFVTKEDTIEFYDYAFIPDYETSVLMNKLFRNIKENSNLDTLEESDDEDEFENNSPDKYVYLDRFFKMKCHFNFKFKKWMPISLTNVKDPIISHKQLPVIKNV